MAVFAVPTGVMGGVQHPLAALGFPFFALVVHCHRQGFVVGKEHHVRPFLDHRGHQLGELQFPPVIGAHFVGLFKLADFGVGGDDNMNAPVHHILQKVEQLPEGFRQIGIPLAIAPILNAVLLGFVAEIPYRQLFRPVGGIQRQCPGVLGVVPNIPDFFQQLRPALGVRQPGNVHAGGTALGIDEYNSREGGGKGALSDSFRPVQNDFLGFGDDSTSNLH